MHSVRPDGARKQVAYLLPLLLAFSMACQGGDEPQPGVEILITPSSVPTDRSIMVDVALETGIDFVHHNGMTGERYFVEMMGSGAALFDFDQDGDLDIYLPQGHRLKPESASSGREAPPIDRLYRNELISESVSGGELHFVDATAASGILADGYGLGVAVGDIDNDGYPDLYVCNWGEDQLWRNLGDGRFEDVTEASGISATGWSASASFFDYDLDGLLDLYVARYVDYRLAEDSACYSPMTGEQDYCGPQSYRPQHDLLFHNLGNGRFEEVGGITGIAAVAAPGLGVVSADFDQDGWPDLYVANDGQENQLWMNREGRRFENRGPMSGSAVNRIGVAEASMGVVAEDFDRDADIDLFMTHLQGESNTLLLNDGAAYFEDRGHRMGIEQSSLAYTAFGIAPLDYDNDGWLDLLIANGAVTEDSQQRAEGIALPLRQSSQLLRNLEGQVFEDITDRMAPELRAPAVGRGVAYGDVDNDGDTDVLITRNHDRPLLLQNRIGHQAEWVGLRLTLAESGRDAYGAQVRLQQDSLPDAKRMVRGDGSYASANDPRVVVGLGRSNNGLNLSVRWPGGELESWTGLRSGQYHELRQGGGTTMTSGGSE